MTQKIKKSVGITETERALAAQCAQSFLSLWSYPNVYSDRGKKNGKGCGKEICNVLVVFGNDVIIFSDKHIFFGGAANIELDWTRWYKRAIKKSAEQVYGAERWLSEFPDRIFLDPQCTQRLPIELPPPEHCRVHRVVVAQGAAEACREYFSGGSGSLYLKSSIVGDGHTTIGSIEPFRVGVISPERGYIHVLDEVSLSILLRELDTISDFCAYLTAKEKLITSDKVLLAAGEEELLAYYLMNLNAHGDHDLAFPDGVSVLLLDESHWKGFKNGPCRAAKEEANRISYTWDSLIEQFNRNIADGTLHGQEDALVSDHELPVRIMAGENRLARRNLSRAIIQRLEETGPDQMSFRMTVSEQRPNVAYGFLLFPLSDDITYEEYRERRAMVLEAYCRCMKLKCPEVRYVLSIAMEPHSPRHGGSEDLMCIDTLSWTNKDFAEAKEIQKRTGFLANPKATDFHDHEYPVAGKSPPSVRREQDAQGAQTQTGQPTLNRKERRKREKLSRQSRKH